MQNLHFFENRYKIEICILLENRLEIFEHLEIFTFFLTIPDPNQPLACTDMTFLTTLLDLTVGGLKPGSVIRSSRLVEGFTAEWPLGSAFYVYENGL